MNDSKLLIDASNLHVGGGVQVGASIANEIARLVLDDQLPVPLGTSIEMVVSSEVSENLESILDDASLDVRVSDSTPRKWAHFPSSGYAAALTVFGPYYRKRNAKKEVVGFALPRMIYPLEEAGVAGGGVREQVANRIRWRQFRAADELVTETSDSANRLMKRLPERRVHVVPNCASHAVRDESLWIRNPALDALPRDCFLFAAVARDYPHKNLGILPPIGRQLQQILDRPVRFLLTLSASEWGRRRHQFGEFGINIGLLTQRELGPLYAACTATIAPSLLEISSATPLESMCVGVPVLLADLPAMRATFGESVGYFSPFDPDLAARQIAIQLATLDQRRIARNESSLDLVGPYGPRDRAANLLQILTRDITAK